MPFYYRLVGFPNLMSRWLVVLPPSKRKDQSFIMALCNVAKQKKGIPNITIKNLKTQNAVLSQRKRK